MATSNLLIRINADLKEAFKRKCEREGKTMSRRIIEFVEFETKQSDK